MKPFLLLSLAALVAVPMWAAPSVTGVHPRAIVPGRKTVLTFHGPGVEGATQLWTSFGGTSRKLEEKIENGVKFEITCPQALSGIQGLQLSSPGGASEFQLVVIDPLRTIPAAGERQARATPMRLEPPIGVDATASSERVDYYAISAKAAETFSIEAIAHRIGSELDPVVHVYDASGREVAFCDDEPGVWRDARFTFTAATAGEYVIAVHDTGYGGGGSFFYHLRVTHEPLRFFRYPLADASESLAPTADNSGSPANPPASLGLGPFPSMSEVEPNDLTNQAQPLFLPSILHGRIQQPGDVDLFRFKAEKDQKLVFQSQTRSLGSPCDLLLKITTADGKTVAQSDPAKPTDAAVTNQVSESGTYLLDVRELSGNALPDVPYRIKIAPSEPGVMATIATNHLRCAPGREVPIKVLLSRYGWTGPVQVTADHPSIRVTEGIIPEGKTESTLTLQIPKGMTNGAFEHLKLRIQAEKEGMPSLISTAPALHRAFPLMLKLPDFLDGIVSVTVESSE